MVFGIRLSIATIGDRAAAHDRFVQKIALTAINDLGG